MSELLSEEPLTFELELRSTMFSVAEKRAISQAVQDLLRATGHPELPAGEIQFRLMVAGAQSWSWADIRNNGAVTRPDVNPHNEAVAAARAKDG